MNSTDATVGVLTIIGLVITSIASVTAVVIAARALVSSRQTALVDQLVGALGDLVQSLYRVQHDAVRLDQVEGNAATSREALGEPFYAFTHASARIRLLSPALKIDNEYEDWILMVAHNFAADLYQADEFESLVPENMIDDFSSCPSDISETHWALLGESISYHIASAVAIVPRVSNARGLKTEPVAKWWGTRVLDDADENRRNVYNPESSYLIQAARLLDDFTREYVEPWATEIVRRQRRG